MTVAIRHAHRVRHFGGGDHVAQPHLGGLEAELRGNEVDAALHGERGFGAAGAAIGRVRHFVGRGDAARYGDGADLVRPRHVHGGVIGDAGADRIPGAAIDDKMVAQRQDAAVVVETDFDVVDLVARMARAQHVLVAVLDPFHRPAEPARQIRDQQIFRIDMALDAKTAADIERDAADFCLRQPQHAGRLALEPMHHLGGGPDRHRIGARIVQADDTAAFHRQRDIAVMIKAPLQPARRALENGVGVTFADGEGADQVGGEFVVDDGGAGIERLFRIQHRRQRLEIEFDQLRRVFGGIAVLRHDDRNRLADMADLVMGQQRLLRIDELVLHQRRPFARQRQLGIRHRRQFADELWPGQHMENARRRGGARHVDRLDARVGLRAAHEDRMHHVRQFEIGNVLAAAGQEPPVLAPRHGAADEGGLVVHCNGECGTRVADNQSTPARPTATYLNFARFISSAR